MDKASAIGTLLILCAVIGGVISSGAPVGSFFNMPSVFIVLVGTFGAVMISYRLEIFFGALTNIAKAFQQPTSDPIETIDTLVNMADISRKGGYLALEDVEVEDPFIEKARNLLIDGSDADNLDLVLSKEIFLTKSRNNNSVKVLNTFTEIFPAMGMVGTLIGLVAMLLDMDDPKSIGGAMAVALLTTLYGALMANGVTLPLSRKLSERATEIKQHQSMVRDAFLRIANGENPKAIHEFLQSYLDETKRTPPLSAAEMAKRNADNEAAQQGS